MGSLQDALLKSGLVDESRIDKARSKSGATRARPGKPAAGKPAPVRKKKRNARNKPDSDLARAYAARRKAEAAAREEEKLRRVADQEARRQRNLALDQLVAGKALNREDAELPRYFEHIQRIRRVLCTPEQRQQINNGELGVVNLRGRYLIVDLETLARYRELAPDLVPDLTPAEPDGEGGDYPPVPDDITW